MAKERPETSNLSGVEKASILMMTLDENVASKIFSMMTEDEIRQITQAMSSLGKIDQGNIEGLMDEFSEEISSGGSVIGDIDHAKKVLTKALGAEKVESLLGDISGPAGKDTWDRLNNVPEDMLAAFLKNEHPQTVALIVSKIKTSHAAKVIAALQDDFAMDVITRMIEMEPVKKDVIDDIEKILQTEFMTTLSQSKKIDSFDIMAEIFNNFDRNTEQKFFDLLDKKDPNISERIRELMFTFEDLIKIDAAGIQLILRSADKTKLPIALKGANDDIKKLFFQNMSERAAKLLKEEMESLGPIRVSEVDEAQMSIVLTTKQLADDGQLVIPEEGEEEEQMIY